jgi:hypothetical protein
MNDGFQLLHTYCDTIYLLFCSIQKYVRSLVSDVYKKVTMAVSDDDSHIQR